MRTIQFVIFASLALYIIFCFHLIIFQGNAFDVQFLVFFLIPFPILLCMEMQECSDASPFLVKLNRNLQKDGLHAREPTGTEKAMVKSFFDEKRWEVPPLFTCHPSYSIGAAVGRCHKKNYLVLNEQTYRMCTPQEIWAILAHEKAHLMNGDIFLAMLEKIISFLSLWVSVLAIMKIWKILMSFVFLHTGLLYPLPVYYLMICVIILFVAAVLKKKCHDALTLTKEILADVSASQILETPMPLIKLLQKIADRDMIEFQEREKALLWILKKGT